MTQFKENPQADRRADRRMDGTTERPTEGQTGQKEAQIDPILQDPSCYCKGSKNIDAGLFENDFVMIIVKLATECTFAFDNIFLKQADGCSVG